jgi:hypothetical protein
VAQEIMHRPLNRLLLLLALPLVLADAAWIELGHFAIDARNYALVGAMVVPLALAALYYDHRRNEPALSATLAVSAFLIIFPAAASLLSYLLLTIAGPRIDGLLAQADLALGFHWTAVMALAADHPRVNMLLSFAYLSVMPQTVFLIFALGLRGRLDALYGMALSLAVGALLTLAIWTLFPSFGAFSVFTLPDDVARKLGLVLGADYGRSLTGMLRHGPGFITPTDIRGIVGFPSYHTLQALVLFWHARQERWLRWPALVLNATVLIAIPVQGGHHLMDMFGGAVVTVVAILISRYLIAGANVAGTHLLAWPQTLLAIPCQTLKAYRIHADR